MSVMCGTNALRDAEGSADMEAFQASHTLYVVFSGLRPELLYLTPLASASSHLCATSQVPRLNR
jgi:hypothetical protein